MYYASKPSNLGWVELIPSIATSVLGLGISAWGSSAAKKEAEHKAKLQAALQKEAGFQEARALAQQQALALQQNEEELVARRALEVKIMLGAVAGVAGIVATVFLISAARRKKR